MTIAPLQSPLKKFTTSRSKMFDGVKQRYAATGKLLEASHDAISIFVDHIGGMGPS